VHKKDVLESKADLLTNLQAFQLSGEIWGDISEHPCEFRINSSNVNMQIGT
jgi:hypothetical protein